MFQLWWGESPAVSADPFSPLQTQGVLGVVLVLILALGQIGLKKIEAAHARELAELKEAHARELEKQEKSREREVAQKDHEIAALRADKAALDAIRTEQEKFIRDTTVPAMIRTTDIAHEYVEALSRRAIGGGP